MNLPLGTAGTQLSHCRRRTGDHKMRDAEYTCDLMDEALTLDCQLEAHLWCPVVQSRTEAQPVFRLYWNYYTRQLYLWLLSQRCGEADL
jgi:hypothetical protein